MFTINKSSRAELFTKLLLCSAVAATLPLQSVYAEVSQSLVPYSFATTPGRLPKNVIPTDYVIAVVPDAGKFQISGTETVSLDFTEATDKIQFNSLNQKLAKVLFDGKPNRNFLCRWLIMLSQFEQGATQKFGDQQGGQSTTDYAAR